MKMKMRKNIKKQSPLLAILTRTTFKIKEQEYYSGYSGLIYKDYQT